MMQLRVGTNAGSKTIVVDEYSVTPREAFESQNVNYQNTTAMLNGTALVPGFLDKTFAELGISGEKASLFAMTKADNAR